MTTWAPSTCDYKTYLYIPLQCKVFSLNTLARPFMAYVVNVWLAALGWHTYPFEGRAVIGVKPRVVEISRGYCPFLTSVRTTRSSIDACSDQN